ncbi:type IIG restriction enzyme/methyltransferase [Helicobacter pylori]|uniref:type IIG restriction enzyme/methyltransferase n=1 Tax=Helicobacter pylori TaxID=210 RepID=UPI000991B69B|nr:class I SAM-dependent DNA methyltransferase [Helicobacter pylori]OOQ29819.1 restriction endonuclease [Helicobacter pylori]PDX08358.1 restriction endonuclease [Helicobacter pylori]WQU47725.1 class I SAM-dependent DNA methyltransferase [Helicobacter pylori]
MIFTRIPLKDFIKKYNPPTPTKETIENFEKEINSLLENAPRQDGEEFQKNKINSFLKNTYGYDCNTYDKVDSAIYVGKEVRVLIEVKALDNKTEFPKNRENPLSKAFCQMVLYFLEEIEKEKNNSLKHTIICNAHEFFLFDCKDLLFLKEDKRITKLHKDCAKKEGTDTSTKRFYSDLEEYLKKDFQGELRYTHFNLSNYDPKELPLIYQVLSHEVLLKQRKTLDANTLNKDFYEELLYILGLKEQNEKGKILIKPSRTKNSLSAALKKQYNNLDDEEVMALLIAWNNRILFLRLLESLLISFKHFEKPFLTTENFKDFNALNALFFEVLAKKNNERSLEKEDKISEKIPYLNSSLFDKTPLESNGHEIKSLNNEPLEIHPKSILKKDKDYQKEKALPLLKYLFEFLHFYKFTTTPEDIKDNKDTSESRLINPSVLGLVFEKLNGYKEGSFYTPSFITSYMCKESITPIVLDKFNQTYNIECENLTELRNYFKDNYSYKEDKRKEYLQLLLTLRVCDPAVGSGHFLVSALNEMVLIAYELGLIASLYACDLRLENDEIIIHTPKNEVFKYTIPHSENDPHHQIQKELFELKKDIIENCLFGVDINPNSCEITKLRLWIELLKYSYYIFEENKNTNNLETLPNIDINIKCANSLIFNFPLNSKLTIGQTLEFSRNLKAEIKEYKNSVMFYKEGLGEKAKILQNIAKLKSLIINYFIEQHQANEHLKETLKAFISEYGDEIFDISTAFGMEMLKIARKNNYRFNPTLTKKQPSSIGVEANRLLIKIKECYETLENLKNSKTLEWRFEFPEVLNDEGDFLGFDCIIGNPPYIRQEHIKDIKPLLEKQYQNFYNSTADIYTYFFALSYHLLKEKGFNAFITSNKYARAKYGAKLRELLLKKTTIVSYMELNALKVFESATVDTSIIHFIKQPPPKESLFNYYEPTPNDKDDLKSARPLPMRQNALSTESFIFANATLLDLRDKIESVGTPLKDWDIQIYRGILTGANEAFIIPTEKREEILNACKTQEERGRTDALIKPILRGKDIKRYSYEWAHLWVINTHNGYTSAFKSKIPPIDIAKYPTLKAHLDSHYDAIVTRSDQGDTPYNLRNCAYLEDFEKEKIVWNPVSGEYFFTFIKDEFYFNNSLFMMTSKTLETRDLYYILGLLNTTLYRWLTIQMTNLITIGKYAYGSKDKIERLPIPKITEKNQELADKIIALVDKILKSKEKDPKANTQGLEKEIDALVYQLYNLTDEEIKIIEEGQEIKSD